MEALMLPYEILSDFSVSAFLGNIVIAHLNCKLEQAFLHRLCITITLLVEEQDKWLVPVALRCQNLCPYRILIFI